MAHGAGRQRPGSEGEHALQRRIGSDSRADRFYDEQVLDHLNERMREFTRQQEMLFLATSDRNGECDSSFRAGPPGFLRALDERTLVFPEYRGNGVHASLGNIQENPHLGILLIDFVRARIGLHINGSAEIVEDADLRGLVPDLPADPIPGRRALLWVRVNVEEAYIHCAKHIPHFQKAPRRPARDWGTDDYKRKGGDFFGSARDARDARDAREPRERVEAQGTPEPQNVPAHLEAPGTPEAPAPMEVPVSAEAPEPREVAEVHERVEAYGTFEESEARAAREFPGTREIPGPRTSPDPLSGPPPTATPAIPMPPAAPAPPAAPEPAQPTAPSAVSAAISARAENDTSGYPVRDVSAWREQAERALAEARRRGAEREPAPFQGWFG